MAMEVLNSEIVLGLIAVFEEYKTKEMDYEELLLEHQNQVNGAKHLSKEVEDLFIEMVKFEDYLHKILEVFYKASKLQKAEEIYINLVPKMSNSDIKKLALTTFPLKWKILLKFLCQKRHFNLVAETGTDVLDFEFCHENILEPLKYKLKWMKQLGDELHIKLKKLERKELTKPKLPFSERKLTKIIPPVRTKVDKNYKPFKIFRTGQIKGQTVTNKHYQPRTQSLESKAKKIEENVNLPSLSNVIPPNEEDTFRFKDEIEMLTRSIQSFLATEHGEIISKEQMELAQLVSSIETKEEDKSAYRKDMKLRKSTQPKQNGEDAYENEMNQIKRGIVESKQKDTSKDELKSKKRVSIKLPDIHNRHPLHKLTMKPVALNTATILREGATIQQNEWKQLKRFQDICNGGYDPSFVETLEAEMREQERMEAKKAIEARHLQGLLCQEEALLAKEGVRQKNRDKASHVKFEKYNINKMKSQMKAEEELLQKNLIEKTRMIRDNAQRALKKTIKTKQKKAQKLLEEKRSWKEAATRKKEEESAQRAELIKEIHRLHGASALHTKKPFDLTQIVGWGLSCEMSIAELQERLCLAKSHLREETEERKKIVKRQQQEKKKLLKDMEKYIAKYKESRKMVLPAAKKIQQLPEEEPAEIKNLRKLLERKRMERKKLMEQPNRS